MSMETRLRFCSQNSHESYAAIQEVQADMLCYAKSLQSCVTLCNPIDSSPPGSPIPGILQARTLEWVAVSFSNAWKWKVKGKSLSRVRPSATPWTAAFQAPPSMGFSRHEYWSGVPLPSPEADINLHYSLTEVMKACIQKEHDDSEIISESSLDHKTKKKTDITVMDIKILNIYFVIYIVSSCSYCKVALKLSKGP